MKKVIPKCSNVYSLDDKWLRHPVYSDYDLVFCQAADTVSSNTLVEYLMMTSLFEPLLAILADGPSRQQCGYHAVRCI